MPEAKGLPYMTFATFSDFLTPSPLVTYRNQVILFLWSAFWGPPPSTHCRRHIWKPPSKTTLPCPGFDDFLNWPCDRLSCFSEQAVHAFARESRRIWKYIPLTLRRGFSKSSRVMTRARSSHYKRWYTRIRTRKGLHLHAFVYPRTA